MKKLLVIVILLLVAVLMTQTVPDKAAHKAAMMEAVKAYVDEEAENRGFGDNALTKLGKNIVNKTVEVALNSKLQVNNYYLFNTTHISQGGNDRTLSLGILGHVFTFDKKMLREALEKAADEKDEAKNELEAAKVALKDVKRLKREQLKEERRKAKEERRKAKEERRREKEERKAQKNK
ncbi:MAG: DUF4359 domain-containing protein [Prevotella sp.]|jgi:hypothetical protein|nr:DUF4359 domain-containing protein [Prevotella sp.]